MAGSPILARSLGLSLILACLPGIAHAYEICSSAPDCLRLGLAAQEKAQWEESLDLLSAAADLATGTDDKPTLLAAYLTLTEVNIANGTPLMAHAWAQTAFEEFEDDDTAKANLARAVAALPSGAAAGTGGTYKGYAGYGLWQDLDVSEKSDGTLIIVWRLFRIGAVSSAYDYGPAAEWHMKTGGRLQRDAIIVTYPGDGGRICEISFARISLGLEVVDGTDGQSLDCQTGGAGVAPYGKFWRVESGLSLNGSAK